MGDMPYRTADAAASHPAGMIGIPSMVVLPPEIPAGTTVTADGLQGGIVALAGTLRTVHRAATSILTLFEGTVLTASGNAMIRAVPEVDGPAAVNQGIITVAPGANTLTVTGRDEVSTYPGAGGVVYLPPLFAPTNVLENDGTINVRAGGTLVASAYLGSTVLNLGQINIAGGTVLLGAGSTGGTVRFLDNGGTLGFAASALLLPGSMPKVTATVSGFRAGDRIKLEGASAGAQLSLSGNALTIADATGSDAVLTLQDGPGGHAYALQDFTLQQDGSSLTLTTTADAHGRFAQTSNDTGEATAPDGTAYSGPVGYLQWQYIATSDTGVAVAANVPNAFLHGGAGDDALAVSAGQNVLDGGAGSNFLVGTTDGTDTFFLDGRGGAETWSTLVHFHQGDMATVFGFAGGTSTLSWAASEGAAGYQGATLHAALGGAGTPVNASITFAGLSLDDVAAHFTLAQGVTDGSPYLMFTYA